jgi:diguanylate cyclase (GGDEF)-like protein
VRDDHDRRVAAAVFVTRVAEEGAVRDEIDAARAQLRGVIDSQIDPWIYLEAMRADDGAIVDFAYRDANDAALIANRMPRDELLASTLLSLLPGHATNGLLAQYVAVVETGRALSLDDDPYASELTGGEIRWFDNRLVKVGDGLSFTWRDVTDRVLLRQRLAREATSDPLTGLVNRAGFAEAAQRAFARSHRRGEKLAMFYCDVDGLKLINDTYGHEWGDLVLRTVADRLAGTLRTSDIAARIGGDEFVVIADGITDSEAALAVAMKIADAVTRPITHAGRELVPTLSIGLAVALPGETVEDVLRHADEALYRHKRQRDLPTTDD